MDNTAIVVGATGLVGSALVDQLSRAAHIDRVVTLTRRGVAHELPKVVNRVVDFEHLERDAAAFQGRYLFCCLGTTLRKAGSIEAQRVVDLEYPYQAALLASRAGVRHFLLVSSSFADAQSKRPYLQMKGELEQRVLALPFERVSIFQPSVLLGPRPEGRPAEALAAAVLNLASRLPRLRRYRPIRGDEVAEKMVQVSARVGPRIERFALDEVFPG